MLLTRFALVAVALAAIASAGAAAEQWVFLGTYTGKDGSKTCNTGNPGRHGIHRILTRTKLEL